MCLASYAKENGYKNISIIDFNVPQNIDDVISKIKIINPKVISLSGSSSDKEIIQQMT